MGFVVLKTFSFVLVIWVVILLKSVLDVLALILSWILMICDLRSLMILLQYLTWWLRIDLWVLHNICFSDFEFNCLRFNFTHLGTIFLLRHLRLKCKWKRYVDDIFSIIPKGKRDILLNYLNSIDPHIKFTVEQPNVEGAIPFLDTFLQPKGENISVSVYRKPTLTHRYLDFNSSHPISAKKLWLELSWTGPKMCVPTQTS